MSPSGVLEPLYKAGLRPGVNWRKELTELINDIAARDNVKGADVLKAPEIQAVLNHKKLSGSQKLEKVKDLLFAWRYPTVALARKIFNEEIRKLKISPKIKVRAHPYFESDKLKVEIKRPFVIPSASEESLDIYDSEIINSIKKLEGADLVKNALKTVENNS